MEILKLFRLFEVFSCYESQPFLGFINIKFKDFRFPTVFLLSKICQLIYDIFSDKKIRKNTNFGDTF